MHKGAQFARAPCVLSYAPARALVKCGGGLMRRLFRLPGFIHALYFENNRARAVVAAGNHHLFIVRPAAHNGAALQRRIHIAADGVPRLGAKFAVQHMHKVVPPAVAL